MTARPRSSPLRRLGLTLLAIMFTFVTALLPGATASATQDDLHGGPKPTIVLVHGAFADASGWNEVTQRLQQRGYTVYAPANPLRGLSGDSAYLRSFLATIPGPIVLVGHSYGGAVITNAATGNPHVQSLVYVAAYALAQGEPAGAANGLGGHPEESLLLANILPRDSGAGAANPDVYINPAHFREVFAGDLSKKTDAVMAASQRPAAFAAFTEPSGVPAWLTIPSWYLVASNDHAIPPTAERAMAARAHATTLEIDSSHVAMISHPDVVTDLIMDAAGH